MTNLLTLEGIGQRFNTFRFEVLDKQNSHLGGFTVDVDADSPPSISNSINRNPKRQLDGLHLPPSVTADINTLTMRLRPWMVFQDGTEYPLGVFLFADASRELLFSGGVALSSIGDAFWTHGAMLDQLVTLNQGSRGINFYGPGKSIYDALVQQLEAGGVIDYRIEPTEAEISEWVVWKPNTNRLKVINDLCAMAGFYSLYFDNTGVAQVRKVPSMDAVDPLFIYGPGGNVINGTPVESDDLLKAPNSYVVVNSGFTEKPIWGEWRVPAEAPNSFENIGYWRVQEYEVQGITSNAQAVMAAKARGQADYSSYRWVDFAAAIDPRHDTFDVVEWKGDKYREQQWDFPLTPDGDHKHELRRVWSSTVADLIEELDTTL